jgi:hypothetical protein
LLVCLLVHIEKLKCKKMDHHGIFRFRNPCLVGYENEKEKKSCWIYIDICYFLFWCL